MILPIYCVYMEKTWKEICQIILTVVHLWSLEWKVNWFSFIFGNFFPWFPNETIMFIIRKKYIHNEYISICWINEWIQEHYLPMSCWAGLFPVIRNEIYMWAIIHTFSPHFLAPPQSLFPSFLYFSNKYLLHVHSMPGTVLALAIWWSLQM